MPSTVTAGTPSSAVSGLYRYLPERFLDAAYQPAGGGLVADLPPVGELGWEAELRDPRSRLDHMICIQRRNGGLDAFQRWCDRPPGQARLRRHPEWRRLRAFLAELEGDRSPYAHLDNCWLEFDLSDGRANREVPSLFIGLGPPLTGPGIGADDLGALLRALGHVRGAPVPGPTRAALATCWSRL